MSESIRIDYAPLAGMKADMTRAGQGAQAEGAQAEGAQGEGVRVEAAQVVVLFAGPGAAKPDGAGQLGFGEATKAYLGDAGLALVGKAAGTAKFKGKPGTTMDLIAPAGFSADRLLVVGTGGEAHGKGDDAAKPFEPANLGGIVAAKIGRGARASVLFDLPRLIAPSVVDPVHAVAEFALGLRLRDYRFDLYKTKKKDEPEEGGATAVTIAVADVAAVEGLVAERDAVAVGVLTARSLVNEPANVLYPETFAERAKALEALGVSVEILDEAAMGELGMGAILGVSRGSARPARLVVMRWNGVGADALERSDPAVSGRPVAFVGKGVTFDTGGISIKPAGGMEDMKGDMAGAACVVGLMQALAGRRAKVNVIGAIGLVENMPGPEAQRPGDIVTSLSGQTIEIINTDAEGRLVLADVCWYVQDKYKPRFMIDLATLTGAILVALGQEHAGLFSNDDALSEQLLAAGRATGEKVWRMPLTPGYDKLIDSRFADMKNTGGRHAGSITAAHFIKRFVNDVPWAHLDIAGTGMASPGTDINQSWGSGWGVRLLDRLIADHYETR